MSCDTARPENLSKFLDVSDWSLRRESNPDLPLRRRLSYPLDDGEGRRRDSVTMALEWPT